MVVIRRSRFWGTRVEGRDGTDHATLPVAGAAGTLDDEEEDEDEDEEDVGIIGKEDEEDEEEEEEEEEGGEGRIPGGGAGRRPSDILLFSFVCVSVVWEFFFLVSCFPVVQEGRDVCSRSGSFSVFGAVGSFVGR